MGGSGLFNTEPMSNIFDYLPWYIETKSRLANNRCKTLETTWQRLSCSLKGVNDRTAAENLVGANIWISKSQLPKAGMDEFYWSDLKVNSVRFG